MTTRPWCEGPEDAPICIIGEAPGATEILRSRPFVGPAGKVLDQCLHQAGLLRHQVRIENVVKEKIKDTSAYLGRGGLTQKGREAAEGLRDRLTMSRHKILVPMGNLALAAVTGLSGITKYRGSPLPCSLIPDMRVIPTIHPAATLPGRGKYIWIYNIVSDLKKVKRHSQSEPVPYTRRFVIDPTHAECLSFLRDLKDADSFAFDIEIYNYHVSCISFAPNKDLAISVPFVDRWSEGDEAELWLAIADVLEDDRTFKIGQNHVGFDIPWLLYSNRIRVRGEWGDTMIAQRIMYPEFPSGLDFLCSIYTDEPYYKDDKKLWKTPARDPHTFWEYNAKDSATCAEIWPIQLEDMREGGYLGMYKDTMRLAAPVHYMMARGIKVDIPALEETKERVEGDLQRVEEELRSTADYDFNPGSPKQCLDYFYVHKGIKPYINRKTKRPTCDDVALARLARRHNLPEARLAQEVRSLRKLKGTYLEIKFDPDNYLRCSYGLRGTTSGRLSSSKTLRETGMNMQNLDPRFKHFLVTDGDPNE